MLTLVTVMLPNIVFFSPLTAISVPVDKYPMVGWIE